MPWIQGMSTWDASDKFGSHDVEERLDEHGVHDYAIMRLEAKKFSDVARRLRNLAVLQEADPSLNALTAKAKRVSQCSMDEVYSVKINLFTNS